MAPLQLALVPQAGATQPLLRRAALLLGQHGAAAAAPGDGRRGLPAGKGSAGVQCLVCQMFLFAVLQCVGALLL